MNKIFTVIVLSLLVSACGSTREDRALSGAGIGAATGAVGAAVFGGNVAKGAVIGGALGAAGGAATKEEEVNLGRPWWKR